MVLLPLILQNILFDQKADIFTSALIVQFFRYYMTFLKRACSFQGYYLVSMSMKARPTRWRRPWTSMAFCLIWLLNMRSKLQKLSYIQVRDFWKHTEKLSPVYFRLIFVGFFSPIELALVLVISCIFMIIMYHDIRCFNNFFKLYTR